MRGEGSGGTPPDLLLAAIRYHLIVLGEAVHHVPADLREDPIWRPYLELRNHLAHEYFRLDHARVADLIGDPLDAIERAAIALLKGD